MITSEIGLLDTGNFAACAVNKGDVISLEQCQLLTHLTFRENGNAHKLTIPQNSKFVEIVKRKGKFQLERVS